MGAVHQQYFISFPYRAHRMRTVLRATVEGMNENENSANPVPVTPAQPEPAGTTPATETAAEPQPLGAAKTPFKDRVLGARAVVGVAAATLLIGGLGGGAIGWALGDHDRPRHGDHGFAKYGPGGHGGPNWPGQSDRGQRPSSPQDPDATEQPDPTDSTNG